MRRGQILAPFCFGYSAKTIFDPRDLASRVKEFDCYAALVNDAERKMTMFHFRSNYTCLVVAELNVRSGDARSPGAFIRHTTGLLSSYF